MKDEIRLVPLSEAGYRSDNYTIKTCPECGQKYRWYHSYIKIKSEYDRKEFCSYNCRNKYDRKRKKEIQYKDSESYKKEYNLRKLEMYHTKQIEVVANRVCLKDLDLSNKKYQLYKMKGPKILMLDNDLEKYANKWIKNKKTINGTLMIELSWRDK